MKKNKIIILAIAMISTGLLYVNINKTAKLHKMDANTNMLAITSSNTGYKNVIKYLYGEILSNEEIDSDVIAKIATIDAKKIFTIMPTKQSVESSSLQTKSSISSSSSESKLNSMKTIELNSNTYVIVDNAKEFIQYEQNKKLYQAANSSWVDACAGFSMIYCAAIGTNDFSIAAKQVNNCNNPSLPSGYAYGSNKISSDDKQEILSKVYDNIAKKETCILHVNGNTSGTSRHYVAVVGIKKSVTSRDSIKESDLLIIDVWDGKLETMGNSGNRFMITGYDTGRSGSKGYGYQILVRSK